MLTPTNLDIAYKRVKANTGIDGMMVEDFPAFAQENWEISSNKE